MEPKCSWGQPSFHLVRSLKQLSYGQAVFIFIPCVCVCWTVKYNRSFRVCYDLMDRDQNIMELIVDLDSLVKWATSIADDKLSLLYMYILTFERLLIIKGKR